jgi:hypothetical protein
MFVDVLCGMENNRIFPEEEFGKENLWWALLDLNQ